MGQGPVAPWRPSPAVPPGPAHLAHEDQRLSELSLADGTDVTDVTDVIVEAEEVVAVKVGLVVFIGMPL